MAVYKMSTNTSSSIGGLLSSGEVVVRKEAKENAAKKPPTDECG